MTTKRQRKGWHIIAKGDTGGNAVFECLHCGATMTIAVPVGVKEFCAAGDSFNRIHIKCPKPEVARDDA